MKTPSDKQHAYGRSGLSVWLANFTLLDFRPRAVCGNSFICGMLTGCGISFGTYGAVHLDGVTLFAAFFFLVFAKLAHGHIRLDNVQLTSPPISAGETE